MAPKDTPDDIAAVLEEAVKEAAHTEAFRKFYMIINTV